jgi:hypothetical protein
MWERGDVGAWGRAGPCFMMVPGDQQSMARARHTIPLYTLRAANPWQALVRPLLDLLRRYGLGDVEAWKQEGVMWRREPGCRGRGRRGDGYYPRWMP